METYPLDIDPEQVVRWIKAEQEATPSAFRVTASRTTEVREIPVRKEAHLGDEERENLSEVATIATLEIAPVHAGDGWLLSVVVEDEVGPRIADASIAAAEEQRIDLGTFYKEFVRPSRGIANVVAEVEDAAARARLNEVLSAIDASRHRKGREKAARAHS
jgi:hypothetical protein